MEKEKSGSEPPDWDERYKKGYYNGADEPHDLLVSHAGLIPAGGRVADIAMGQGRDALYLASRGFRTTGLERSWEALKLAGVSMKTRGLFMDIVQGDAERLPFKDGSFQGVIVFYFLLRRIAPDITAMLDRGGILIYETFLKRQNEVDRPRNPAFLLDDGELLSLFPGFEAIHYDEGVRRDRGKVRATARLVARKI